MKQSEGLLHMKKSLKLKLSCLAVLLAASPASAQEKRAAAPGCKPEVFARLKPLPVLDYSCRPDQSNDYDEAILKWPERLRAIKDYMLALEALNERGWWEASTGDLNLCYFRGETGPLDSEQAEKVRIGDYQINLFGDEQIRLVLAQDPCYQTGYGGSNAFLLYRRAGRVFATEVLDGYFSRADNSVALDFAQLSGERVIEVSTSTGGLQPYRTNYYFVIDKRSGRAVPKRIFKEGKGLTNKISSVMILDDGTFPKGFAEMEVVKDDRLAGQFYTYEDTYGSGRLKDASGRSLRRIVHTWNGRYYTEGSIKK
jgi:hypothetical protein